MKADDKILKCKLSASEDIKYDTSIRTQRLVETCPSP